jgi:hypothetical protein
MGESPMEAPIQIPVEARAAVECNALFDALRHGDYSAAARAQERLRELGWDVRRLSSKPARRPSNHQPASQGQGGGS